MSKKLLGIAARFRAKPYGQALLPVPSSSLASLRRAVGVKRYALSRFRANSRQMNRAADLDLSLAVRNKVRCPGAGPKADDQETAGLA